jgi:hypothetical protein
MDQVRSIVNPRRGLIRFNLQASRGIFMSATKAQYTASRPYVNINHWFENYKQPVNSKSQVITLADEFSGTVEIVYFESIEDVGAAATLPLLFIVASSRTGRGPTL